MAEMLTLVRHGQTPANINGRWHGSTDSALTWRGRRQAKRTAKLFAARETFFDHAYVSPMTRCQDTASPTLKRLDLDHTVLHTLREWDIGEWEDMKFSDLAREHRFMDKVKNDPHFAPPAGESVVDVAARMVPALAQINDAHEGNVLIVSHGAAMAVALAQLLDRDARQWPNYLFDNCGVTELVLNNTPYVNYFNRTEHL